MRISLCTKPAIGIAAALAFGSLATAQTCPGDDTLEENDDCLSPAVVTDTTYTDLSRQGPAAPGGIDEDYYRVTVPAFTNIQVDLLFTTADGDIDLYLWDEAAGTCPSTSFGDYLVRGFTGSDNETVDWDNNSGSSVDYLIGVDTFGASFDCNDYDMVITFTSLLTCPDPDALEDNDDCASAVPLSTGLTEDLSLWGDGNGMGRDEDFYTFDLADGEVATIDALFLTANGDMDLRLYDDAGTCSSQVASSTSTSDDEQIVWANTTGGTVTYTLYVEPWGSTFDCNDYDLNLDVTLAGTCPGADSFEPNDDCVSASALAVGTTPDLSLFGAANGAGANEDYWTYTAVNNEVVTIDALFIDALGDIDLTLYDDAACTNVVDSSASASDDEQVSFTNTSGGPITLTLQVEPFGSTFDCNNYELEVTSAVDPCLSLAEDSFAPNHDCASAAVISAGSYPGLATFKATAEDFFAIDVPSGNTLNVDVLFTTADGDIDCYLYESATLGSTCGDKSDYLVNGFTGTDNESISWDNTTGSTQTYYLQVNLWDSAGNEDCNSYDLVVGVDPTPIGASMCPGDGSLIACPCGNDASVPEEGCLNSTGSGATIGASGSTVVADDSVTFTLDQAPTGQTCVLVQGTSMIAVPFKDGILCMGVFTRRVQFGTTDGSGSFSTTGSIIAPANLVPGETRYYQFWYRNPVGTVCGDGSNTSAGIEIDWL